ncbi:MAG: PilN domain-containing protein [Desulfobacterales bacterium]
MIRINLLPFRTVRKKENIRRQLSIFVLSLVLTGVALFGLFLLLDNQVEDLKQRIASTQTELAKYEKINREIEEIKKKLDQLNQKLAVIRELEASRHEPVALMDTLARMIIEKRMWLTGLDAKSDTVNLSGIAMDDKTVADFMLRLEGCGLFSAVNLKTLRHVEIQKTNLKSFEISCQKKPPLQLAEASGGKK